jgi:hypothetical protein
MNIGQALSKAQQQQGLIRRLQDMYYSPVSAPLGVPGAPPQAPAAPGFAGYQGFYKNQLLPGMYPGSYQYNPTSRPQQRGPSMIFGGAGLTHYKDR